MGHTWEQFRSALPKPVIPLVKLSWLDLSSTYQLDDTDISMARTPVDFYAMPPKELGNMFVEAYFRTVHPLFPVTFEPEFMQRK